MIQRTRLQAIVLRADRILMAKIRQDGSEWWCLPGGGWEAGETAEEGVLRELWEECNVRGTIVRQTAHVVFAPGDEAITFLVDIGEQEPSLGIEPELAEMGLPQPMVEVRFLRLREIAERDRAFLWAAGLLGVGDFWRTVEAWGDDPSYPAGMKT
jgi:8-oxo-dGTP diphosphatase